MKNYLLVFTVVMLFVLSGVGSELLSHCPMCRATAESNLANGGTEGKGLNNGIMYMLGMPYVLIGTVAFLWWKHRAKDDELEQA